MKNECSNLRWIGSSVYCIVNDSKEVKPLNILYSSMFVFFSWYFCISIFWLLSPDIWHIGLDLYRYLYFIYLVKNIKWDASLSLIFMLYYIFCNTSVNITISHWICHFRTRWHSLCQIHRIPPERLQSILFQNRYFKIQMKWVYNHSTGSIIWNSHLYRTIFIQYLPY